jgi:hypothetical protein
MADELDRRKVSFSEAEGASLAPDVLKWGQIDQRLRAAVWNAFWVFFDERVVEPDYGFETYYLDPLHDILLREHVHRRHGFANEFVESFHKKPTCINQWANFFRTAKFVDFFDFVTFFLRDRDCPTTLIDRVADALDEPWSPYRLVRKPPTIFPVVSKEEAKILTKDLTVAFKSKFEGAKTHLRNALDALNQGDNRAVVRESIHAVESAVRDFTGDKDAILSSALKKIGKEIHPTLALAFEKLYAYSSDEKGIRHALVFADNEKVGFDEAMFFISACAAFIGLLSRKLV